MSIELWRATSQDEERFRRLYELYCYDFSYIYQLDADDTGSSGTAVREADVYRVDSRISWQPYAR